MAGFTLVHGSWHGGWAWEPLRRELEARGHTVATPDLPCEDVTAGVAEYAQLVPPADVLVGHSLGGLTIPLVPARLRVFLCALVPGLDRSEAYVPGFGSTRSRDELGRSYYPDPTDAARELQYPEDAAQLAQKLRRQRRSTRRWRRTGPPSTSSARATRRSAQSGSARRRARSARPSTSRRATRRCSRTRASWRTSSSQLPARQASCDDAATARRSRSRPRSSRTHSVPWASDGVSTRPAAYCTLYDPTGTRVTCSSRVLGSS